MRVGIIFKEVMTVIGEFIQKLIELLGGTRPAYVPAEK